MNSKREIDRFQSPAGDLGLHIQNLPDTTAGQSIALFGFQIPYLPDFLTDHTLLSEQPLEKLKEVHGRTIRLIRALRKWRNSAFALRFMSDPVRGQIQVALLGRMLGPADRVNTQARQMADDMAIQLSTHNIPFEPLGAAARNGSAALRDFLFPYQVPPQIVEVRQQEAVVPLMAVGQEAYVIYPFWGPASTYTEPFEALIQQRSPATISILLQPYDLSPEEQENLFAAAHLAETVADLQRRVQSESSIQRFRDPGAEMVGKVYSKYRESLDDPFLLVCQVASMDANTAWNIARALATAVAARPNEALGGNDLNELPSQAATIAPQSESELAVARRTFGTLMHRRWGQTQATPGKEQLPYLVGARGAASAFRFPISVRGGVPGVVVRQQAPDFETGGRRPFVADDEVHLGTLRRGAQIAIKREALTRHGLITGFTGSGKTNTMLHILDQLWTKHRIPFMVIESAKKEYRGLLQNPGFRDLLVFTLGDETTAPFRLNPFELLPGVRLEAHLGNLQTCFDGALPQFGILPTIIAEALETIYRDKGWRLTDRGGERDLPFPTMRDMYQTAVSVAESRGYAGETYHNIRAAVSGRIGGLLRGSKGRMFGAQQTYPVHDLMHRPVILELNDLNADDKALTIMFLLVALREYRELNAGSRLQHITVVEEAHNVMGNIEKSGPSEIAADSKGHAVEAFTNLLTEVRAYGEGILIADQSPQKLAPDALRNTNLQIAHQLRDAEDREAIARGLLMDPSQQEYLGKLSIGEAVVFQTGMEKATFMQVPPYKAQSSFNQSVNDKSVNRHMREFIALHRRSHLPFDGCRFCESPCVYLEDIERQIQQSELRERFQDAVLLFDKQPEQKYWQENWDAVTAACQEAALCAGHDQALDAAYCFLVQGIDFAFNKHMRQQFEAAFRRLHKIEAGEFKHG